MPDVLTHLMVGISVALLVRRDDNRPEQMLIILGALLIDIERPISWLLELTDFGWIELTSASHSILGAVILSYFAATCIHLEDTDLRNRAIMIFIGCLSHLILDLVMYPWPEVGLFLLYPLKIPFSFNLLWPDFWWFPAFGFMILIIMFGLKLLLNYLEARTGPVSTLSGAS
jgi:hypothetical protein